MDGPIDQSGDYTVNFAYTYTDLCGNVWEFPDGNANFLVDDCPLNVYMEPDDPVSCAGSCIEMAAIATGGDGNYSYVWNPSLPNTDVHTICPTADIVYSVTVTDGFGTSATGQTTITVISSPDAGSPISVCEEDAEFVLSGTPPGGTWDGPGVDGGIYYPHYDNLGVTHIHYTIGDCTDSLEVTTLEGWAWWDQAVCTGSAPFFIEDGSPTGGTWTGPNVQPNGLFDPSIAGDYELTYTAPNGCTDTKTVFVEAIDIVPITDPVCQSVPAVQIDFSPFAGWWNEHSGFENTWSGEFSPFEAGPGVHLLTYNIIGGCSETISIEVVEIDAGGGDNNRIVLCPDEGILTLNGSPSGGVWTAANPASSGLLNAAGLYDPSIPGAGANDNLIYTFGACADPLEVRIRNTSIGWDYFEWCPDEEGFELNWDNVHRSPGGGSWSGPGVVNPGAGNSSFDPALAGSGVHTLYYTRHGCTDSMTMVVFEVDAGEDISVCDLQSGFDINATNGTPPGGYWFGDGIEDTLTGRFSPENSGLGSYEITYQSPDGCSDVMNIIVEPVAQAVFGIMDEYFCFTDTTVLLTSTPPGGEFSGIGITGNAFNPMEAGEGSYILSYTYGTGDCSSTDQVVVVVGRPLEIVLPFVNDSICPDKNVVISAQAAGGVGSGYQYTWNNGVGEGQSHLVNPEANVTYAVTVSDACTQPVSASIEIAVAPPIEFDLETSEPLCNQEDGYVNVINPPGAYVYEWETGETTSGINAPGGFYDITVTDTLNGCEMERVVEIPKYDLVVADFIPTPNGDPCLTGLHFEFLDLSAGAISGSWSFGDGTVLPYANQGEAHSYAAPGTYTVELILEGAGGCMDTLSRELCIEVENELLLPDAFSPNGDGMNDVFKARGVDVRGFNLMIYNRWGQRVFETSDIAEGWDGNYNDNAQEIGMYTYVLHYTIGDAEAAKILKGMVLLLR